MQKVNFQTKIIGLIQNNELEKAINLLQEVLPYSSSENLKKSASLIIGRFKELLKQKSSKTITHESYLIERARISSALIEIGEYLTEEIKEEFEPEVQDKIRFSIKNLLRDKTIRNSIFVLVIASTVLLINYIRPPIFEKIANIESYIYSLILSIFFIVTYKTIIIYLNLDEYGSIDESKSLAGQSSFKEESDRDFKQFILLDDVQKKILFDKIDEKLTKEVISTFELLGNKELS